LSSFLPTSASFRDPSGSIFSSDGVIYRRVNRVYQEHYEHLVGSGLYEVLTDERLLIPHDEVEPEHGGDPTAYKVLRPQHVSFVSYPYEWCFTQLKDAALTTLRIQEISLDFGMSLKDASAYNIQFRNGRPIMIDTLSFERTRQHSPWIAYRQFCQHFLAPLALMSYTDERLSQLLRTHLDGIPIDLAAGLLPWRARFRIPLLLHVFLHARAQSRYSDRRVPRRGRTRDFSEEAMRGLVSSLRSGIRSLRSRHAAGAWRNYYTDAESYTPEGLRSKTELVETAIEKIAPREVWDLGANTGLFSRIAARHAARVLSIDSDAACVEQNYLQLAEERDEKVLPLLVDLGNPSPSIGWANRERLSLAERGPADMAMALALIHHLAIGNNVPLGMIADFFASITRWLLIEFVPKSDPQVERLLEGRDDVFDDYSREFFEEAFLASFDIESRHAIAGSDRVLYLMRSR
jgi:hypothetical protein